MELTHNQRLRYHQLGRNYYASLRNLDYANRALETLRAKWEEVHRQRESIKNRVRSARFMSRNYLNALRNFARLQKQYNTILTQHKNFETKMRSYHMKSTRAQHALENFIRSIPNFRHKYYRNRRRAVGTLQRHILDRRAKTVLGSLRHTPFPPELQEKIARSVLRVRSHPEDAH
jgi:DNA repair ATPase RecN